jgi:hypothetical protein
MKPHHRRPINRVVVGALIAGAASLLSSVPAGAFQTFHILRPLPPPGVTATAGNGEAIITWVNEGLLPSGIPVPDGYVAKTTRRAERYSCISTRLESCTITGLTNGVTYRVRVWAYILRGDGSQLRGYADAPVVVTPTA